jgi:adenylate cyclase
MSEERVKRKLSAILSADVAGYSRLMGEDEVSTVKTLETYRKVMSDLIEQFRGRVVDSPGDNLLAEFSSVVDAVQCAVEIHEVIRAKNEELPENRRMLFRIGVNLGDVIEEGGRIYGDGVNIAARLEGLAEPGGICISGSAHEQIENKLALGYEYLGEHTVKNIAKPVKVYRVPMGQKAVTPKEGDEKRAKLRNWRWTALGSIGAIIVIIGALAIWNFYLRGPSIEPASIERMAYPLPDKPSIAVLPFTNMSGDPEQDYIGDGLSENIRDALSVSSQMFVMDRNATFTYKGTPVKPQKVAEDLGVRYILEGSIQKSGDRLRVTAQLIDALEGHYLWSNKYDREMNDLFDLQDEITKKIMVSLQVELSYFGEDVRLVAKSTDNLEAWKHYIRGVELFYNFIEEDNAKARQHFEISLELDPQNVSAMSGLGWTHLYDFLMGWSDSPSASFNHASELAQKAVELDDQDPLGHGLLGYIYLYQGQYENAIFEGRRAINLNPNYAIGCENLGFILSFCGQFDEAITMMKKGYRLNPNLHPAFLINLAGSYIFLERYEKALEVCNEMEEHTLSGRLAGFKYFPPLFSSWIYQELGRQEEAHAYMAKALKREPDISLELVKMAYPYKNPAHLQRMEDAFRKAGMPEHPPGAVQEKPSIAVLPFDDLSPEKDQEYFVLGLSEEILNTLTKIPDLQVTSKTSSFSFKGTNKTIQEIAEILGREYVLEGSVRKVGSALKITAQLIRAADDSHIWSETYDRELKDIFKIQEDIATNIANKLKLTLEAFQLLGGTEDVEAYELYLSAKGLVTDWQQVTALEKIDEAIAKDQNFALAWTLKVPILIELASWNPDYIPNGLLMALETAQRAIEIEPMLGKAYLSLGSVYAAMGKFIEAEKNYKKGMDLEFEIKDFLEYGLTTHYGVVGRLKKACELIEKLLRDDPLNPNACGIYIFCLGCLGDMEEADKEYKRKKERFGSNWLAGDVIINGLRLGAKDVITVDYLSQIQLGYSWPIIKANLESPEKGIAKLRGLYNGDIFLTSAELTNIALGTGYFGDYDFAMEALEKSAPINVSRHWKIWFPIMREVRQLPRFKEWAKEIGLVDYWKTYGWPDLCHPVSDDDFECN